jgi:Leucine-rich repeat (LRR) protein
MDQDQLAARIAQAGDEGWATLDLSGEGLKYLPPEIGNLTGLTWLWLSGNQLTALPPEIGNLTGLTDLDLDGNQLTALPP